MCQLGFRCVSAANREVGGAGRNDRQGIHCLSLGGVGIHTGIRVYLGTYIPTCFRAYAGAECWDNSA